MDETNKVWEKVFNGLKNESSDENNNDNNNKAHTAHFSIKSP